MTEATEASNIQCQPASGSVCNSWRVLWVVAPAAAAVPGDIKNLLSSHIKRLSPDKSFCLHRPL